MLGRFSREGGGVEGGGEGEGGLRRGGMMTTHVLT